MHCRRQLVELTDQYEQIRALDAEVLAISTDDLSGAKAIVDRVGIPFPILYDSAADLVREYGVYDLLGDGLAAPSTFVIDTGGVVRWSHVGRRTSDRASAQEILDQLQQLRQLQQLAPPPAE